MPDNLLMLTAEAEAAAAALASSRADSTVNQHADRAIQRLQDSAQRLSAVGVALTGERNGSEPQPPTAAASPHPQSREPAAVA